MSEDKRNNALIRMARDAAKGEGRLAPPRSAFTMEGLREALAAIPPTYQGVRRIDAARIRAAKAKKDDPA